MLWPDLALYMPLIWLDWFTVRSSIQIRQNTELAYLQMTHKTATVTPIIPFEFT